MTSKTVRQNSYQYINGEHKVSLACGLRDDFSILGNSPGYPGSNPETEIQGNSCSDVLAGGAGFGYIVDPENKIKKLTIPNDRAFDGRTDLGNDNLMPVDVSEIMSPAYMDNDNIYFPALQESKSGRVFSVWSLPASATVTSPAQKMYETSEEIILLNQTKNQVSLLTQNNVGGMKLTFIDKKTFVSKVVYETTGFLGYYFGLHENIVLQDLSRTSPQTAKVILANEKGEITQTYEKSYVVGSFSDNVDLFQPSISPTDWVLIASGNIQPANNLTFQNADLIEIDLSTGVRSSWGKNKVAYPPVFSSRSAKGVGIYQNPLGADRTNGGLFSYDRNKKMLLDLGLPAGNYELVYD